MIRTSIISLMLIHWSIIGAQTDVHTAPRNDGDVWTLDRCVEYAMTHATDIRRKKVESENAREERDAAAGGFMPSLYTSMGTQLTWGRNVDPETNVFNTTTYFNNSYSLSGSLTLFDGAQTWNYFRKARLGVRRSDNALAIARDEKIIEVMERYVDVVYNEASLRIAKEKLADSRLLLQKTQRMETLGEKSYPDVAQMEAQVAEDEYMVEHQKTAVERAVIMLKKTMGMQESSMIMVDGNLWSEIQEISDEDEWLRKASGVKTNSFSLCHSEKMTDEIQRLTGFSLAMERMMEAEYDLSSARLNYKIACGRLWPSVTVGGSVSTGYNKNLSSGAASAGFSHQMKNNLGQFVYASLSFPLFNFSIIKNIRKARNNIRLAEIEREETRLNASSDYRQAMMERDGYVKDVVLLERKVASDSVAHHLNTRKYEEGLLSTFDLHTSAQTLHNSRMRLLQTRLMAEIKRRLVLWYRY